ncbi:CBS domain-containing protein [Candidatus Altiarchaeota archaeon]
MLVKDVKVRDVPRIEVGRDIIDALCIMYMNQERCLPVFNGDKLSGTICIADYVKALQSRNSGNSELMNVEEIMCPRVITCSPNTLIEQVIDRLCEKSVYSVPILSGHEFKGVIRREDVLSHFKELIRGKFKVKDVMSYNVSTNSIHDTLEQIGEKIFSGIDRRIVIMDEVMIQGSLTIHDLANVLLAEEGHLSNLEVKDILIPNPASVSRCDDASIAVDKMLEWGVGGIPVRDQKLEGMVRDKDILQRIPVIL